MSNRDALKHLGAVDSNVRAIAGEIADHLTSRGLSLPPYGAPYSGPVMHGYDPNPGNTEHHSRRAIDVMVMSPGAVGEAVVSFVWANRSRYDLQHVIWKQRIRSTRVSAGIWRKMADRGSVTENHMDHPHILFGVNARPRSAPDKPGGGSSTGGLTVKTIDLRQASNGNLVKGPGVKPMQRLLRVTVDGLAGTKTREALGKAQARAGVTHDYMFGPATASALLAGK